MGLEPSKDKQVESDDPPVKYENPDPLADITVERGPPEEEKDDLEKFLNAKDLDQLMACARNLDATKYEKRISEIVENWEEKNYQWIFNLLNHPQFIPEAIREKAVEKGMMSENSGLNLGAVISLQRMPQSLGEKLCKRMIDILLRDADVLDTAISSRILLDLWAKKELRSEVVDVCKRLINHNDKNFRVIVHYALIIHLGKDLTEEEVKKVLPDCEKFFLAERRTVVANEFFWDFPSLPLGYIPNFSDVVALQELSTSAKSFFEEAKREELDHTELYRLLTKRKFNFRGITKDVCQGIVRENDSTRNGKIDVSDFYAFIRGLYFRSGGTFKLV